MNRNAFLKSALGMSVGAMPLLSLSRNNGIDIKRFIEIWQISEELTLEFAEAMPQKEYNFRPAGLEDVYSYGEQMQHIAENNINLLSRYITDEAPPDLSYQNDLDKESIKNNISTSFRYGTESMQKLSRYDLFAEVEFGGLNIPRWHVLFIAQDHTTHHCGQSVVYLNANGYSPPNYRKW